ncbi:MAG: amino acid racemase, partial [Acidobacteria bacterium]|nr:amino acid racemase [Acidobacteriota bacterium]
MKTIGFIGGTGWVSTLEYYRLLNEGVNARLGGVEAARCIIYSFNFGEIARLKAGDPAQRRVRPLVVEAARRLEAAGADGLVLCANTLHLFAEPVEAAVAIPVIHIADAVAAAVRAADLATVGLLGTRATMEQDFYRDRLAAAGIAARVPVEADRAFMDDAIMTEMVRGVFRP